jgi:hypothetical protein
MEVFDEALVGAGSVREPSATTAASADVTNLLFIPDPC